MRLRHPVIQTVLCAAISIGLIGQAQAAADTNEFVVTDGQTASARIQGTDDTLEYRIIDGYAVHQGDIVLGTHEEIQRNGIPPFAVDSWTKKVDDQTRRTAKAAVADNVTFWPNGVVPYEIGSGVSNQAVEAAMDAIESQSDVRFVQRSDQSNYLSIFSGSGCWSQVGMSGGEQALSLGRGCQVKGVAIHELLHALGYWHEQSREDRDQYVQINWDNIRSDRESQFRKQSELGIGTYDYRSIMHYGAWAFSANGEPTMTPLKDGVRHEDLGQRQGMTDKDAFALNEIYGGSENGRPELTLRAEEAVIFNTQSYELVMRLADDQTPVDNLNIDASSSNTSVLANRNIEVADGSQSDEKVLVLTPNDGTTGEAEVSITVTDEQGLSVTKSFVLRVEDEDGGGNSDYSTIHSMMNDQCLTVVDGGAVELAACEDSAAQQWQHGDNGRLQPKVDSNRCLQTSEAPWYGSRASISACVADEQASKHQQWALNNDMLINQANPDMALTASDSGIVFAWSHNDFYSQYYSDNQRRWEIQNSGDGGGSEPCSDCEHLTGELSGQGDSDVQPDGSYYHAGAGTHQAWLDAPDGAIYELSLFYWDGSQWVRIGQASTAGGKRAAIQHNGDAGYYAFVVQSASGQGAYDFWLNRP